MAIGIYKPGQGYWTRVLTATAIGIITLATAAWMWDQMQLYSTTLPRTAWTMKIGKVEGAPPAVGQTIDLVGKPERVGAEPPVIGTANVKEWNSGAGELRLTDVKMNVAELNPSSAKDIRNAAGFHAPVSGAFGFASIDPTILAGSVASVIILIGFIIAYYICAMNPRTVEFLISTDMEMKKVNWSSWKDIRSSTMVVIAAAVFLAGALFLVDLAFQQFFRAIGVLSSGA